MDSIKITRQDIERAYNGSYFDIRGIKIAAPADSLMAKGMTEVVLDSFGNYLGYTNEEVEDLGGEGIYILPDRELGREDVVIDAGAYVGDFSAYASTMGAKVYAFEPDEGMYKILKQTVELNERIIPVNFALSDKKGKYRFYTNSANPGSSTLYGGRAWIYPMILIRTRCARDLMKYIFRLSLFKEMVTAERIKTITLDSFVESNNIKVTFIKADIEGSEEFLLKGAANVLQTMEPDISMCTYHRPGDREILENLIKQINPNYRVIQKKKKLYAYVP